MFFLSLVVPILALVQPVVQPANNAIPVLMQPSLSGYFSYNGNEVCASQLHLTYTWPSAPQNEVWAVTVGSYSPFMTVDNGKGPVHKTVVLTVNTGYGSPLPAFFGPTDVAYPTPPPQFVQKIQRPCKSHNVQQPSVPHY